MSGSRLSLLCMWTTLLLAGWNGDVQAQDRELSPKDIKIGIGGVGPLKPGLKVTLTEIGRLLPGFEAEPTMKQLGGVKSPVILVSYLGQPMLEIFPGPKDELVAVHIVSADIASPSDTLMVGGQLDDIQRLERCTLVGEQGADGISCSVKGLPQVSFRFQTLPGSWSGAGLPAATVMQGVRITTIEWTPAPVPPAGPVPQRKTK